MGRGGRGGGRGGRGGPQDRETLVSKKLSWLLRHGAEKEGLKLGKGGYVGLADVLSNRTIKSLQPAPGFDEVQQIVKSNAKQRFSLIHKSELDDPPSSEQSPSANASSINSSSNSSVSQTKNQSSNPSDYLIRANQGHSLKVSSEGLLTSITASNIPRTVVHGTREDIWPAILKTGGLKPMTRNHIHLATGVPAPLKSAFKLSSAVAEADATAADEKDAKEEEVKSGMRNSSTLLVFIDMPKAMERMSFYLSANGVVLTEGEEGVLGIDCFQKVLARSGRVLLENGKVVE